MNDYNFTTHDLELAAGAIQLQLVKYITACYYEGNANQAIEDGIAKTLLPTLKDWFVINNAKERNGSISEIEANKQPVLRVNDKYCFCGYLAASSASYSLIKEFGLFYNDETLKQSEEINRLAEMIEDLTEHNNPNRLTCKQFAEKYRTHTPTQKLDKFMEVIMENYEPKSLSHIGYDKNNNPLFLSSLIENQNENNALTNEMALYRFLNDNPGQYECCYKDGNLFINDKEINLQESYIEMVLNKDNANLEHINVFLWLKKNCYVRDDLAIFSNAKVRGFQIDGIEGISPEKRLDFGNYVYTYNEYVRRLFTKAPQLLPQYADKFKFKLIPKSPEKLAKEQAEREAKEKAEKEAQEKNKYKKNTIERD